MNGAVRAGNDNHAMAMRNDPQHGWTWVRAKPEDCGNKDPQQYLKKYLIKALSVPAKVSICTGAGRGSTPTAAVKPDRPAIGAGRSARAGSSSAHSPGTPSPALTLSTAAGPAPPVEHRPPSSAGRRPPAPTAYRSPGGAGSARTTAGAVSSGSAPPWRSTASAKQPSMMPAPPGPAEKRKRTRPPESRIPWPISSKLKR